MAPKKSVVALYALSRLVLIRYTTVVNIMNVRLILIVPLENYATVAVNVLNELNQL